MNTSIATLAEVYRDAKAKAESAAPGRDWQKWLIIAAAVIGAALLLRSLRCVGRLALGLFWIWFWMHGAWRWIF